MSLTNIKERASERGFTIVELLIVIVIIGILAGIVILAYAGLTNQAKTSKAQSISSDINKKFEAFNADPANSGYPVTVAGSAYTISTALTSSTNSSKAWYVPSGSYYNLGAALSSTANTVPSGSTGEGNPYFNLYSCGTYPTGGFRVGTWNYSTNQAVYTYFGGAGSGSTCTQVITGNL